MNKPPKYNPYKNKGEHYVKTTCARALKELKFDPEVVSNVKNKDWLIKFEKLSFEEKIQIFETIILIQESLFKEYMANFKNYHILGVGSIRELQDRRYCLKRSKELQSEFPDMPNEEIYNTLRREILERRLEKSRIKNRKYKKSIDTD